jgi:hypothetical protein
MWKFLQKKRAISIQVKKVVKTLESRKTELKNFVVKCPNCQNKDIVQLRKRMVSTQADCRRCHKHTWLRVIGEAFYFGDKLQFMKLKMFEDA